MPDLFSPDRSSMERKCGTLLINHSQGVEFQHNRSLTPSIAVVTSDPFTTPHHK